LVGKQIAAFGLEDAKVGDKFTATIHGVVKAMSAGDRYDAGNPGKSEMTLSCTHCTAEDESKGGADETPESEETPEDEEKETPDEENAEEESGTEEEPEGKGANADEESSADEESEGEKEEADTETNASNDEGQGTTKTNSGGKKKNTGVGFKKKPVSPEEANLD